MIDDEFFSTKFSDRVAIAVPQQISCVSLYFDQDHTDTKGKQVASEMEPTCYISDDVCLHQQSGSVCLPQGVQHGPVALDIVTGPSVERKLRSLLGITIIEVLFNSLNTSQTLAAPRISR